MRAVRQSGSTDRSCAACTARSIVRNARKSSRPRGRACRWRRSARGRWARRSAGSSRSRAMTATARCRSRRSSRPRWAARSAHCSARSRQDIIADHHRLRARPSWRASIGLLTGVGVNAGADIERRPGLRLLAAVLAVAGIVVGRYIVVAPRRDRGGAWPRHRGRLHEHVAHIEVSAGVRQDVRAIRCAVDAARDPGRVPREPTVGVSFEPHSAGNSDHPRLRPRRGHVAARYSTATASERAIRRPSASWATTAIWRASLRSVMMLVSSEAVPRRATDRPQRRRVVATDNEPARDVGGAVPDRVDRDAAIGVARRGRDRPRRRAVRATRCETQR